MSKARLDLPDPLTPVTRVSWLRGIWISRFLRLFCRAPVMVIQPLVRVPLVLNRVLPYVTVSSERSAFSLIPSEADRFLATVQIGVTLVSPPASVMGGAAAVEYLSPIFRQSTIPFLQEWGEVLALGIVVLTIAYLSLVLGELVPKSLALHYPERIACAVARPLDFFSRVLSVAVKLLTASSNLLLFFSGTGAKATEALVSEEEVKYLVREGAQKGVFDETEKEFIHSVFEFADTSVREVMTPRTEIHALEVQTSCAEALHEMIESGFSRMPVYEEDLDRIIGIVHIKELLRAREQVQTTSLRDFLHPAYFVPDSMQISHLLR